MHSVNQYMANFIGSIKSLFVIEEPQLIRFHCEKSGQMAALFGKDKYIITE
jgi:hypothetical protein